MTKRQDTTEIIIHCTATPEGKDYSVETIRNWHKRRGFQDIGYHYIVHLDGTVSAGRAIEAVGAHCTGHNDKSIGIVYVGGLAKDGKTAKDTRTAEQKEALRQIISDLRSLYGRLKVYGHRDFARKACPCFDAKKEYN